MSWKYQNEITNTFAAFENLRDDEHSDRAWEYIKEKIHTSGNMSLGLHELDLIIHSLMKNIPGF
jgi:hypothetical protein